MEKPARLRDKTQLYSIAAINLQVKVRRLILSFKPEGRDKTAPKKLQETQICSVTQTAEKRATHHYNIHQILLPKLELRGTSKLTAPT